MSKIVENFVTFEVFRPTDRNENEEIKGGGSFYIL